MASRLYFGNVGPPLTVTTKGGWGQTTGIVNKGLTSGPIGGAATIAIAESSNTANFKPMMGRWVSAPLQANYTFSAGDTINISIGTLQSSASAFDTTCLFIWVTQGNVDASRGTLLALTAGGNEWTLTTAASSYWSGQTLGSVSAQAGDRIVVEFGYNANDTSTTSFTGTINYGNSGTTDLNAADGDTNVTTRPGWIEFSPTNLFGNLNASKANFSAVDSQQVKSHIATRRYWVGNGGNWGDTAHWATTSNGSSGASVPDSTMDVFVDANSFTSTSQTLTVDTSTRACRGLIIKGVANNPTFNTAASIEINDAILIDNSMTITNTGGSYINIKGSNTRNIDITPSLPQNFTFVEAGGFTGVANLVRNLTTTATWFLFQGGTLNTNGYTITTNNFSFNGSSTTRTLNLGSSTINVASRFEVNGSGYTFNAETSTINITSTNAELRGGGATFNNVTFQQTGAITGSNTIGTLTVNAGKTLHITSTTTQTLTTLTLNSSAGNVVTIDAVTPGSRGIISIASGTFTYDYVTIKDNQATGGAKFFADVHSTNNGNNLGWEFIYVNSNAAKANIVSLSVDTYYFDASDAAIVDNENKWTSDASAFDGSTSTSANLNAAAAGSTAYLMGEGTNSPTSGSYIYQVRARIYGDVSGDPTPPTLHADIYTNGLAELIGSASNTSVTSAWGAYTVLSTPSGGWTWQKINDLEVKIWNDDRLTSIVNAFRVEIEVTSLAGTYSKDNSTKANILGAGVTQNSFAKTNIIWIDILTVQETKANITNISTYYFDASLNTVPGTPDDPNTVWTNDPNGFDGSTLTFANTSTGGSTSSNYLYGKGTTALDSETSTISAVRARLYGTAGSNIVYAAIYTQGLAELLETTPSFTVGGWSPYVFLNTPSGGWNWSVISTLETKVYGIPDLSSKINRVELDVYYTVSASTAVNNKVKANIFITPTQDNFSKSNVFLIGEVSNQTKANFASTTKNNATIGYIRGLLAWWKFDDATGDNINDYANGSQYDLTNADSSFLTWDITDAPVVPPGHTTYASSIQNTASNQPTGHAVNSSFPNYVKDFTVQFRIKPLGYTDNQGILGKAMENTGGSTNGWKIRHEGSVLQRGSVSFIASETGAVGSEHVLSTPNLLTIGQWRDVAVIWEGGTTHRVRIYIDGWKIVDDSSTFSGDFVANTTKPFVVGAEINANLYTRSVNAKLSDIKFYNYALTDTEVYANAGPEYLANSFVKASIVVTNSYSTNSKASIVTTVSQNFFVKANLVSTISKDTYAKGNIVVTGQTNFQVKADILVQNTSSSCFVKADIITTNIASSSVAKADVITKDIQSINTAKADILALNTSYDQKIKGNIIIIYSYQSQVKADILVTVSSAEFSKADIQATYTYNSFAKSDIKAIGIQDNTVKANIVSTTTRDGFSKSDIVAVGQQQNQAKSDILVTTTQSLFVKANIPGNQSSFAKADILVVTQKNIQVKGDIISTGQVNTQAKANILVTGNTVNIFVKAFLVPWWDPYTLTINTGSIDSGNLRDVYDVDGTHLVLNETTSSPGFDYVFTFIGVPVDNHQVNFIGTYTGQLGHIIKVKGWNFTYTRWDNLNPGGTDIPYSATDQHYNWPIPTPLTDYISGGEVRIQIYHVPGGNDTHKLNIDQFTLEALTIFGYQSIANIKKIDATSSSATKANILVTTTSNNTGKADILATYQQNNFVKSDILVSTSQQETSKASIVTTVQNAEFVLANIFAGVSTSNSGFVKSFFVFPNAILLDGTTQYGTISNFSGLDGLQNITYEGYFWNDPNSSPYATTASLTNDAVRYTSFKTENGTGNEGVNFDVEYSINNADGYKTNGVFPRSTWVHVALVGTLNNKTKIYVNGTELSSYNLQRTPSGTILDSTGFKLYVGRDKATGGDANWKGKIGGFFRMWNYSRSASQVSDYKAKLIEGAYYPGLIVNLNFLEGSGTVIDNEATAGADLNLTGSPTWTDHIVLANERNNVSFVTANFIATTTLFKSTESIANILAITTQQQQVKANIVITPIKSVVSIANILVGNTYSAYSKANIVTTYRQDGFGKANILVSNTATSCSVKADFIVSSSANNAVKANSIVGYTQSYAVKANILATYSQSVFVKGNVPAQQQSFTQANVIVTTLKNTFAKASIFTTDQFFNQAVANVLVFDNAKSSFAKANIIWVNIASSQNVKADIIVTTPSGQSVKLNIVAPYSVDCFVKADVTRTVSSDGKAKADIISTSSFDQFAKTNITASASDQNQVKGNITTLYSYNNFVLGNLYGLVAYSQFSKASLIGSVLSATVSLANILAIYPQDSFAKANVPGEQQAVSKANILGSVSKNSFSKGLIFTTGQNFVQTKADILVYGNGEVSFTKSNIIWIGVAFAQNIKADILSGTSSSQSVKSNILKSSSSDCFAKADIVTTVSSGCATKADIVKTASSDYFVKADITASASYQNQVKADVLSSSVYENSVHLNFSGTVGPEQFSKASIVGILNQTTVSLANILASSSVGIFVKANIPAQQQNQTKADIVVSVSKNTYSLGSIVTAGQVANQTKANILGAGVTQNSFAKTNIIWIDILTVQETKANIVKTGLSDQFVKSNIVAITEQNLFAKSNIPGEQSVYGKANIKGVLSQNSFAEAYIFSVGQISNQVKGNILVRNVVGNNTAKAGIITLNISDTNTSKANIRTSYASDTFVKSDITASFAHDIYCKANVLYQQAYDVYVKGEILSVSLYDNISEANIGGLQNNFSKADFVVTQLFDSASEGNIYYINNYTKDTYVRAHLKHVKIYRGRPYETRETPMYNERGNIYGKRYTEI